MAMIRFVEKHLYIPWTESDFLHVRILQSGVFTKK